MAWKVLLLPRHDLSISINGEQVDEGKDKKKPPKEDKTLARQGKCKEQRNRRILRHRSAQDLIHNREEKIYDDSRRFRQNKKIYGDRMSSHASYIWHSILPK